MVALVIIGWEKIVAFCFLPIYFRSCVLLNYFIICWAEKAKSEAKNSRDSRVEFISKDLVTRPTYIRSTYRYLRIIFFRNNIFILSEHGLNLKRQFKMDGHRLERTSKQQLDGLGLIWTVRFVSSQCWFNISHLNYSKWLIIHPSTSLLKMKFIWISNKRRRFWFLSKNFVNFWKKLFARIKWCNS